MTLRGRVFEGTLTRGQLRAHVMQFSGHTRIVMEDVPELARVLADDAVPSTPVHAGEYELLLGCLRSHFDTYKGPPAPPVAPVVGGGAATAPPPPPPPAPPGLPGVPGTPLGSRTAGARGLQVVIVPDDELSSGAAPSSDVSDVTGPSMGGATAPWVAVSPSALDLDTPSRGTMMPSPAVSSALGGAPPGAPSPQDRIAAASEERARAAQRSADAAERLAQHAGSTARDSRVTADAVERKEAKSKPNAFRQVYETRRWVACNGGDHVGYTGRDERVDAPIEDELDAVLGTDAQAAEARSRIQIPIPPERRTSGGRVVDRGGLWFAFMQGSDWYSSVQTAVSKPVDAFHQFGLTFQVTHKAIECFGRVAFGPPYGITPDWTPYKDLSQLRLCATLCDTPARESAPELISSKDLYKKACRAFGTMFPPCYGTEVKRQWDLLLDRIFALAEPKKWTLATMRRFVDMCLCDFSTRIRAEINKVFRLNQSLARDHGGVALEPTVNELMARSRVVNPTTGLRFIGCPHQVSFSIAIRDGTGSELGPLGTELAQVVMQADVDQNETKHAKAQDARNKAWEAQISPPVTAAAKAAKDAKKDAKKEKAKADAAAAKKAEKDAQKKAGDDAKAAVSSPGRGRGTTRGRGGRRPAAAAKDDGDAAVEDDVDADGEAVTRATGTNPLLEMLTNEFISAALRALGKRCGRSLCHDQCSLSPRDGGAKSSSTGNVVCQFEHPPEPLTSSEIAALPVETRIWSIVYGGFRGQTKVPYAMRRAAIGKALAELSGDSRGNGLRLPARFYEQYREVTKEDSELQIPLHNLVADNITSVFEQRPEAPRYHEPEATVAEQDAASDGSTLAQHEYRASLVASGVLSMLTSGKQSHKLFTVWFANWVYEQQRQQNGGPPSGAASDVDWLNWARLALESGVCSSPLLRDAAARVKAGLEGSRGTGTSAGVACVVTGAPTLIVHASLDIAGELAQACVHVMGLTFIAYEVGDEVHVGELSVASKSHNTYSGQCVIKSDAISDLVATRCRVTNKALAARCTQYLESIFEEAMAALDHLGPMGASVSIEEAEAREHISDRKYFTEADVHYTTVLGGAHRTRDILRYDTSYRRKIIVTARCAGAMMRVLVVDGQLFGRDENSWVTYQLLYDHHCRPMVPVDDQYDGHSGSERFLAHAKSMQIDVIRRNELDWRDLGGRADATLVPVSTFHSVHGDRVRVRTPDPALNTVGPWRMGIRR